MTFLHALYKYIFRRPPFASRYLLIFIHFFSSFFSMALQHPSQPSLLRVGGRGLYISHQNPSVADLIYNVLHSHPPIQSTYSTINNVPPFFVFFVLVQLLLRLFMMFFVFCIVLFFFLHFYSIRYSSPYLKLR